MFAFQDKGKSALNLSNVAGIFHILIGGLVLSMIISLSQIVFHAKIKPKKRQVIYGPQREKTCLGGFANNKDADQPAHLRRLISAFVIRFLLSIKSGLATSKNSIF